MEKQAVILALISLTMISIPLVQSTNFLLEPKDVDAWLYKTRHAKQKVSQFRFYLHDTLSGKDPSTMVIAKSNITNISPTMFGAVMVIDDPLTEGHEPTSKLIGRAQGVYALDGKQEMALLMSFNLVFTSGKYNGSTLAILGHNIAKHQYREMPILGGTGAFRFARGITTLKTYSLDGATGDGVIEYRVVVIHY